MSKLRTNKRLVQICKRLMEKEDPYEQKLKQYVYEDFKWMLRKIGISPKKFNEAIQEAELATTEKEK